LKAGPGSEDEHGNLLGLFAEGLNDPIARTLGMSAEIGQVVVKDVGQEDHRSDDQDSEERLHVNSLIEVREVAALIGLDEGQQCIRLKA